MRGKRAFLNQLPRGSQGDSNEETDCSNSITRVSLNSMWGAGDGSTHLHTVSYIYSCCTHVYCCANGYTRAYSNRYYGAYTRHTGD